MQKLSALTKFFRTPKASLDSHLVIDLEDSQVRPRSNSFVYKRGPIALEPNEVIMTDRPVIGILTCPDTTGAQQQCIMSSYVSFLEQSGGKVVPLLYTDWDEDILAQMNQINGVLLPGGESSVLTKEGVPTAYSLKIKVILEKAKEMNERGTYFPIFAIGLSMQAIAAVEAPFEDTLTIGKFDSVDTSDKISFVEDSNKSKLFRLMPDHLIVAIQNDEVTYNNHQDGIFMDVFTKYEALSSNYQVFATNTDRKGVEYVSIYEHLKYPFYWHQHHPEMIQFASSEDLHIPRSEIAIELSQFYSDFFIHEAKLNNNQWRKAWLALYNMPCFPQQWGVRVLWITAAIQ